MFAIVITTIRTTEEYAQQTAISLMYATRAKKVFNRSVTLYYKTS